MVVVKDDSVWSASPWDQGAEGSIWELRYGQQQETTQAYTTAHAGGAAILRYASFPLVAAPVRKGVGANSGSVMEIASEVWGRLLSCPGPLSAGRRGV